MRLIKMTGGLGNQMFIYAFYLRMKKRHTNTRIDLSDMMHYNVHHGYEMHRVFNLPKTEFCINQPLKKVIEFLFFLKSATKLFSVLLASKRPLITELADKLRLKYPLLPTISPCPTMRLEAIRSIIPISCRRYPKSV